MTSSDSFDHEAPRQDMPRPPAELACPACGAASLHFDGAWATCPSCGHATPTAFAAELLSYDTQYRVLLDRRSWLEQQVHEGTASAYIDVGVATSQPGQVWRTQADRWVNGAAVVEPLPAPDMLPPPTKLEQLPVQTSWTKTAVPAAAAQTRVAASTLLYIIGGALVVFAIIGGAALAWRHLGVGGQAALLGVAALALATVAHLARNKVPGLAFTFAALASITVPVAVLEATHTTDAFASSWYPTVAFAGGAAFALVAWLVSRISTYAWAMFTFVELAFVAMLLPLQRSSTTLSMTGLTVVIAGSALVVACSLLKTNAAFQWASFMLGTIGLALGVLLIVLSDPSISAQWYYSLLLLLAAVCTLGLSKAWRRRRFAVPMYFGWFLLFAAIARASLGNGSAVTSWTPIPLFVASVALLAFAAVRSLWPRRSLPIMATLAMSIAIAYGVPGMLTEGTDHWYWKAYIAGTSIVVLVMRSVWLRLGHESLAVATIAGWILLTTSVASIGLIWLEPSAVPPAVVALPLLAWSVLLTLGSDAAKGLTKTVTFAIGAIGLAVSLVGVVFALAPQHRLEWALYGVLGVVLLALSAGRLERGGVPKDVISVVGAAALAIPFGLACVVVGQTDGATSYVSVIVAAVATGLCLAFADVLTRWSRGWNIDVFAVSAWVAGAVAILTDSRGESLSAQQRFMGVYLVLSCAFLVATTLRRRNYIYAWASALAFSMGWSLLVGTWQTQPIETATLLIGCSLLLAGLYTWYVREQVGQTTSSYLIFTPAILAGVYPSIFAVLVNGFTAPGTRWLTLAIATTALTVAGARWRLGGIFVPSVIALVVVVVPEAFVGGRQVLTVVPAWALFAVLGMVLIAAAARLEWLREAGRESRRWFESLT